MTERLAAMRRVLAVQAQVKRLAEMELATAEARQREVATQARAIDGFIGDNALHGDIARLALRRRAALAEAEAEALAACAREAEVTAEARARAKLVERVVADLRVIEERATERRDLERIVDAAANRGAGEGV